MITLNRADLDFLLRQVTINYLAPDPSNPGQFINTPNTPFNYSALTNALDPSGLREVSGANNNLVGGYWDPAANGGQGAWVPGPNTTWGQANQPFLNQSPAQSVSSAPEATYNNSGVGTYGTNRAVTDTDPRIISNLVATMFTTGPNANPAAGEPATNGDPNAVFGGLQVNGQDTAFVANAGVLGGGRYNGWFVAFGQFFDHGLDFVVRDPDPTATVTINLSPNDPLYDAANGVTSIMVRRADVANVSDAGGDGIFGTSDDNGYSTGADGVAGTSDDTYAKAKYINNTGLLIDQSQTYGSHQSVNALIREYDASGRPTGRVVSGNTAVLDTLDASDDANAVGLATWADIKTNAARIGLGLTDDDIHNAPVLRVDPAGKLLFTPGTNDWSLTTAWNAFNDAVGPYSAALQDPTDPFLRDANGNVQFTGQNLLIDFNPVQSLDSHIITGDGRANENIGLTAVHHVFHEEHNALVENIKASILATGDAAFIAQWQPGGVWDGEKLYQAARLVTESEYNHIAIDQYVGTLYGALPEFVSYSSDINMGVSLEFSQAVFRLGHSMLTETFNVDVANDPANPGAGTHKLSLLEAFVNPALYASLGPQALALGLTTTLGNEVDEFVTPALQQSLLGQPLDLATINIARGRDVGLPTWNEFRQQVYDQLIQNTNNTNGSALAPYANWADVGDHLKNTGTLVNMIAAYAHDTGTFDWGIDEARADYTAGTGTLDQIRATAQALYDAYLDTGNANHDAAVTFMQGVSTYDPVSGQWTFAGADQGFWDIDLWIGGLAERPLFDGPLGTTFSYVILDFAQRQQDGDRFYYLYRTPMGTHLGNEIIENQFGNLVMDHTGLDHLNGEIFIWANATYNLGVDSNGVDLNTADYFNVANETILDVDGTPMPASAGHVIIAGNGGDDYIVAGLGDDTIYGDAGNDQIYGSQGNDHLFGGDGDDYISDDENDDFITGGAGNDRIFAGPGAIDTVFGDDGDDEIHGGDGVDELIGGAGDDMIYGDGDTDSMFGSDGNDYLEGGDSVDEMMGQEGNDWLRGGVGDDHLVGGEGNDLLEGGVGPTANDGDRLIGAGNTAFDNVAVAEPDDTGFDVASYEDVNIAITANLDTSNANGTGGLLDTYAGIDGLVGSRFADNLTGAATDTITTNGFNNLLVGGGGNDILTGLSGDDIIVGDSVATRADFTVDAAFDSVVANWKGTGDDRPDYGPGGAVDLGHFLGENGAAGTADVAVFSGNSQGGYTADFINYGGYNAIRITDVDLTDGDDGTDILIGVEKARFANGDVSLLNGAPVLDLHAFNNVADDFSPAGYAGNDGSVDWNGSWTETNDGNSGAGGGDIDVNNGRLRFGSGTDGNEIITRAVNLSGATSATLSFTYQEDDRDAGEDLLVQVLNVVTNTWETVGTMLGSANNGSGSFSVALTPNQIGANSAIRFATVNGWENGENFYVDNVNITTPINDATNNYSTTFTEDGTAVAIAAGPSITDDGTTIYSAKIVLTNAMPGDSLNRNDIGDDGITGTTDTSVAGQITVNLTGVSTFAAYQAAIQAITFSNASQAPDTTDRVINVTVNDGLFNSNIARATVQVVSSDDPLVAGADTIVTNIVGAGSVVIPDWALLANDTDPDNPILTLASITATNSLNATDGVDFVTVNDTGTSATNNGGASNVSMGTFTYAVSNGTQSANATASVARDTDNITTGNGSQILVGDGTGDTFNSGGGNDIIFAGGGNDELDGGSGADVLVGGAGNDTFIFGSAAAANGDVIRDFQPGDKIDLSAIDANTGLNGNQSFVLFAGTGFTAAGQIIVTHEIQGGIDHTIVAGNTNNNNADAEFRIDVVGNHALTPADFNA